jgi:hypothetical protein
MIEETLEAKLKRHEDALVACMAEITKLREENARLRSEKSDALSFLKEVYNDPSVSPALRVKSAGLCLPHEVPRLQSVPPAIDATCEEIIPLADLITKRRRRANEILKLPLEERTALFSPGRYNSGNGDDTAG